jgi:hypothetical protein
MTAPSWSVLKERQVSNDWKSNWMEYVTITDDRSDNSDSSMDILFNINDHHTDFHMSLKDLDIEMKIDLPLKIVFGQNDDSKTIK